jgi:hypothetical protein
MTGGEGAERTTIEGTANDLAEIGRDGSATVEQVTEQGQPAVRVVTPTASLYVANTGTPLPLRETHDEDGSTVDASFTEYGEPVNVTAPAPADVFVAPARPVT